MNKYTAQSLFSGYKIGKKNDYKYVAVPAKKLDHTCMVWFAGEYMIVKKGTKPVYKERFEDHFGREPYTMHYFKWTPFVRKSEEVVSMQDALVKIRDNNPSKWRKLGQMLGVK